MADMVQPPAIVNPGMDIGDMMFYNFTPAGRKLLADKRALAQQGVTQQLGETGVMQAHKGDQTYIGAENPYDLTQRLPPYQAGTGRMVAQTGADELAFKKSIEPYLEEIGRGRLGNETTTANTDAGNLQFKKDMAPDEAARFWAGQAETADRDKNTATHDRAIEQIESQRTQALMDSDKSSAASKQRDDLTRLSAMLPPDQQANIARFELGKADPELGAALKAQAANNPATKALAEYQSGAGNNATAAEGARISAVQSGMTETKYGTPQELDDAANKEDIDAQNAARMKQAQVLRARHAQISDTLTQGGDFQGDPTGGGTASFYPLDAKRKRVLAEEHDQLSKQIQDLERPLPYSQAPTGANNTELPQADNGRGNLIGDIFSPSATQPAGSGSASVSTPPVSQMLRSNPLNVQPRAPQTTQPANNPKLSPVTPPIPAAQPTSAASMNQLQDQIQQLTRTGQPVPPELLQQYQGLMNQYVA